MPKKILHLKENGGRYFYRRRVRERHQKTLGIKMWNRPCGDVTYQKAVALVTGWAEEDDLLIQSLDDPTVAQPIRQATEAEKMSRRLDTAEAAKQAVFGPSAASQAPINPTDVPLGAKIIVQMIDQNSRLDAQDRLIRYRTILAEAFGPHAVRPSNPDDRDEFDLVKRKLERRISEIAGDPNTITRVAERYYDFAGIRPGVRVKYRRNIGKLVNALGDMPVAHLTAGHLRTFRDAQAKTMLGTSLAAVFTPIKGLLNFAVDEQIIQNNPMGSVKLQKDKRSIEERKWKPYRPEQMQRLFEAMDRFWGQPVRNMSDERRRAIWWAVRVMAFTAMRPKEVMWLAPSDVTARWIKIRKSKNDGSDRVIPLHPELADFPAFFHAGGLKCFEVQTKDRVQSVRHNFERLTRELMDPPLDHPQQVLYSLRSTFSNAMRRAGADPTMRRAILGHKEAGALRHYDDGPEFIMKRNAIRATDPRTVYPDDDEDDDLGADDDRD